MLPLMHACYSGAIDPYPAGMLVAGGRLFKSLLGPFVF